MVFVHGYGEYQHMWRFITPEFEKDHRTVLFDIIGEDQGTVDGYPSERYGTLHGHADDLLRILRALDLHQVMLVGHSVGGMIGALAAIEEPERFAGLVMITASARYVDDDGYTGGFSRADIEGLLDAIDSNYLGWSRATAPTVMADGTRPELTEELVQSFARTNPRIALQFARATFLSDHRDDLPRITLPTLVLQCTADAMVPASVGDHLHEHIPGSRLEILSATGHFPHLSAPGPTVQAVRAFVDTVEV
ncbi:alpha/beta hydrolase [Actinoplanes couchii]|uniref:Hydrolase n=2 Tax=Actinoplanes couchii TaxID=403638 RepID=A0ABQ3XM06_9ACTN|nr:hydrolase [Actinoplanes couchii]